MFLSGKKSRSYKSHFKLKPVFCFIFSAMATGLTIDNAYAVTNKFLEISAESTYRPKLTINAQTGSYGFAQPDLIYPLFYRNDSLVFLDARYQASTLNSQEVNLALAFRRMIWNQNNILGGLLWIDRLRSTNYKNFNQATLSLELLGMAYDFRGNFYFPFGDRTAPYAPTFKPMISGHTVSVFEYRHKDEALPGADIEVGGKVPNIPQLSGFLDYFYFGTGNSPKVHGPRVRLEYEFSNNIIGTASYSTDNVRGGVTFVGFRVSLGGVEPSSSKSIQHRMEDFAIRDIDIVTVNKSQPPLIFTDSRQYWFVNNAVSANGNGTYQSPFNNEADAAAASGNGDVIYTYQGNAVYPLANTGLNLKQNQLFTGSGGDLIFHQTVILRATSAPVLAGQVNLANGVTVSNMTISGGNSNTGIYGNGVSNVLLSNLAVQNITGQNNNGSNQTSNVGGDATGGNGGVGGDAYGVRIINSNNVVLNGVTVANIIGGSANGGRGTSNSPAGTYANRGAGGNGGTGGNATGIDLTNTSATLSNITVTGIHGGNAIGGDGVASSTGVNTDHNWSYGGNAGTGGNATAINLSGSSSISVVNATISNIKGGDATGGNSIGKGNSSYNYALPGAGGTGGNATAINLANAIANLSNVSINIIQGGDASGGFGNSYGANVGATPLNRTKASNGGTGGSAIGLNLAGTAQVSLSQILLANIQGGDANGSNGAATGGTATYSYGGNGGLGGNATGINGSSLIVSQTNITFSNINGGNAKAGAATGNGVKTPGAAGTAGTSNNVIP